MTFTIFDIIILALITISSILGIYRGAICIIINLLGFICSIILAVLLYPTAKDILSSYISNELGLSLVSGTIVYLASLLVCTFFASKIISLCSSDKRGNFDRFMGFIMGFLRGLLFATIIFAIIVFVTGDGIETEDAEKSLEFSSTEKYPEWLAKSESTIYLQKVARGIVLITPENITRFIKENPDKDEDAIGAINRRKKSETKSDSDLMPGEQDNSLGK